MEAVQTVNKKLKRSSHNFMHHFLFQLLLSKFILTHYIYLQGIFFGILSYFSVAGWRGASL